MKRTKRFVKILWSCSDRYFFNLSLLLTVLLFVRCFSVKFLQFHDTSGRSAAGRMAPMGQFQLPTVRVVNPTEASVRFCGERTRFSPWVRAANVPWRESDRPYPWVLQIKMRSVADCLTGYGSQITLVDELSRAVESVSANNASDAKSKTSKRGACEGCPLGLVRVSVS